MGLMNREKIGEFLRTVVPAASTPAAATMSSAEASGSTRWPAMVWSLRYRWFRRESGKAPTWRTTMV